jgi:hypothetical protein
VNGTNLPSGAGGGGVRPVPIGPRAVIGDLPERRLPMAWTPSSRPISRQEERWRLSDVEIEGTATRSEHPVRMLSPDRRGESDDGGCPSARGCSPDRL